MASGGAFLARQSQVWLPSFLKKIYILRMKNPNFPESCPQIKQIGRCQPGP
jgi:hypothetical protein